MERFQFHKKNKIFHHFLLELNKEYKEIEFEIFKSKFEEMLGNSVYKF